MVLFGIVILRQLLLSQYSQSLLIYVDDAQYVRRLGEAGEGVAELYSDLTVRCLLYLHRARRPCPVYHDRSHKYQTSVCLYEHEGCDGHLCFAQ